MLSFFRYRRTKPSQAAIVCILSSARDGTIAALLIFEEQEGDVLSGDDIQALEWGIDCFPARCPGY
jgi:hypothetical protein